MKTELVNASATIPKALLRDIDKRAASLDMTRSQYLRQLARKDLDEAKNKLAPETTEKAA